MTAGYRKKLIEVALPLDAINKEAAREKSIRHGHPSTVHLWWARRPLAACRAVLFASLIDDPDQENVPEALLAEIDKLPIPDDRGPNWERLSLGERRRARLFAFLVRLVQWDNSSDDRVLAIANTLISASTGGNPPAVLDPFCGGGSIPLEAARLGLQAYGSDLNPIAVLITKALVEIPPRFSDRPPVNADDRHGGFGAHWKSAAGLAADVRYYGRWMREETKRRLGSLYPSVRLPGQNGGSEATVLAWIWARTVACPNPACRITMPLVRSYWLSTRRGKQAWVEPIVTRTGSGTNLRFEVRQGEPSPDEAKRIAIGASTTGNADAKLQASFTCAVCGNGIARGDYIDREATAGRMGTIPLALVADGPTDRVYLNFDEQQATAARSGEETLIGEDRLQQPVTMPPTEPARGTFASNAQGRVYGFKTFADYFTSRQLLALRTFSGLVAEARDLVLQEALAANFANDNRPLRSGGRGAQAYADAVATYLAFGVSKASSRNCSLAIWENGMGRLAGAMGRPGLAMSWDFAETNPLAGAGGDIAGTVASVAEVLERLPRIPEGIVEEGDASQTLSVVQDPLISTDPPYFDNVSYADLSDFFYVWLRKSLSGIYPELFHTLLTPKSQELIANPYRFGGSKSEARDFFEAGLGQAFALMRTAQNAAYPLTIFYAFKQTESETSKDHATMTASTGWESMLTGLLAAGFTVTGTWPMRTELTTSLKKSIGALASSIVLVCRPRAANAPSTTRRELVSALKQELPEALRKLQHGNIAPVDLAQAAIGPGMAVFSRYAKVMDVTGESISVRTALQLINQVLDEVLEEQEGEFDRDTRWAIAWFDQFGLVEGSYGNAETLSTAKDVSVAGLEQAGIVLNRGGKVRLLRRDELSKEWDPDRDQRLTVWEVVQHLIRVLDKEGEAGAADVLRKIASLGEVARDLAYRLYMTSERKGWAQEAIVYNGLVVAWPEIARLASEPASASAQEHLL